jgi:hypothetical protein
VQRKTRRPTAGFYSPYGFFALPGFSNLLQGARWVNGSESCEAKQVADKCGVDWTFMGTSPAVRAI